MQPFQSIPEPTSTAPQDQTMQEAPIIFERIRSSLLESNRDQDITFVKTSVSVAREVLSLLDKHRGIGGHRVRVNYNSRAETLCVRVMPSFLHDCLQYWLQNEKFSMYIAGFLTEQEFHSLKQGTGTSFDAFGGEYTDSVKEPDVYLRTEDRDLPSFVVETGWAESLRGLRRDMDLWIKGGQAHVRKVLIVRWSRGARNRIRGKLEVYTRDAQGIPVACQTETIFPCEGSNAFIPITRSELFGDNVFPGRDPDDTYRLSVENIRREARPWIAKMGCIPA